mmetsp:Transcript_23657/g.51716  ORF Transcript_23657/g.51716 Transcript_23657/m.51716 type:complete len:167 (+) Transcript_23657:1803-2303(+)
MRSIAIGGLVSVFVFVFVTDNVRVRVRVRVRVVGDRYRSHCFRLFVPTTGVETTATTAGTIVARRATISSMVVATDSIGIDVDSGLGISMRLGFLKMIILLAFTFTFYCAVRSILSCVFVFCLVLVSCRILSCLVLFFVLVALFAPFVPPSILNLLDHGPYYLWPV